MSKVSVIVPIYNPGNKIHRCIQSILKQTFGDFELILVNDGSTDNSLKICTHYHNIDKRIKIIDKKNEGSIATRMRGIDEANSEYLMFVDADDWINKRMIAELYNEAISNKSDITVCNMYKVLGKCHFIKRKNNGKYLETERVYNREEIRNELVIAYLHGHPFPSSLCAKLFRKELLLNSGKYVNRIEFLGDDLFLNLELLLKANTVKVIDKALYYYRLGGFTSKFMPFLFNDMVNGYIIQKEVIEEFFLDSRQSEINGISIMLLNTFRTCLSNLFMGELNETKIKELIVIYIENHCVLEAINNKGSLNYFSKSYIKAIRNKDIQYLYNLGESLYKNSKKRRVILKMLS